MCAALLAAASSRQARAEDLKAARQSFTDGIHYFDLREYRSALEAFKHAYMQYANPAFLFNIAQCHREL